MLITAIQVIGASPNIIIGKYVAIKDTTISSDKYYIQQVLQCRSHSSLYSALVRLHFKCCFQQARTVVNDNIKCLNRLRLLFLAVPVQLLFLKVKKPRESLDWLLPPTPASLVGLKATAMRYYSINWIFPTQH